MPVGPARQPTAIIQVCHGQYDVKRPESIVPTGLARGNEQGETVVYEGLVTTLGLLVIKRRYQPGFDLSGPRLTRKKIDGYRLRQRSLPLTHGGNLARPAYPGNSTSEPASAPTPGPYAPRFHG